MRTKSELRVAGRKLTVSNLDKVLYPATEFTKAQVIDYYIRVSACLLPHLRNRPVTLKRYPEGVTAGHFYEKQCPPYRPDWLRTASIWSEHRGAPIHYCLLNDVPSLIWAANLANLEIHTSLALAKDRFCPTVVAFDLDPGPPAGLLDCAQVGLRLRAVFEKLGLESFPKTSGSKGLQVYVPLNTPVTYDQTKPFAKQIAEHLEREHPGEIVSKMSKKLRAGKVFIDWSQNDDHKTTVCVYSLRAKEEPTVSTPLTWDEVARALKRKAPDQLKFVSETVLRRVQDHGDLFSLVLKLKQRLPKNS